jgi:O-acetyl-ADP-ribose deacetylase (regulator of RNase III)
LFRQKFRDLIQNILAVASDLNVKTLAMPPLGVGRCDYPPNLVARIMKEEVEQRLKTVDGDTLKEIRFVIPESQAAMLKVCF